MPELRILIADDHEVVRSGISGMLSRQDGWTVCGEAVNGREAVRMAGKLKPDVVIVDIAMPELNGIDATRQIRKELPESKILIFTMHDAERLVQEVFQAGADGYILKSDAGKHLIAAVTAVSEGRHFFSTKVGQLIFEGFLRSGASEGEDDSYNATGLTARERETVQLLAEGRSNKEVATTLGISVKTAETHRAAIMRKLALATFSDLVRYAIRNKIIEA